MPLAVSGAKSQGLKQGTITVNEGVVRPERYGVPRLLRFFAQ